MAEVNDEISVWDCRDSEKAIKTAISVYGSDASIAAAWCALAARCDGRSRDYRFWVEIFERIENGKSSESV